MVFSDPFFLFAFLPLALFLGFLTRGHAFNLTLLAFSLGFYFWGSGYLTTLLLFSIVFNWGLGKCLAEPDRGRRELLLALGIIVNLGLLGAFKYLGFAFDMGGRLLPGQTPEWVGDIALPIGISFFTFQAISYLVDTYRSDTAPEPSLVRFGAYLSFFPQLIAGPIVRYRDVAADYRHPHRSVERIAGGATRFAHGLLKKVLLADGFGAIADACFASSVETASFGVSWLGAACFALQIYFDFSAYSDMAIGLGAMLGIRFGENFLRPYGASSLTDFWRRWHVSLSSWFRDYLYIPLGGNRKGARRTYLNLLLVFALTGLWHGAAATFLVWGLFHGAFLMAERRIWGEQAKAQTGPLLRIFYLAPVVLIGWVIFRADDLGHAGVMIAAMFNPFSLMADIPDAVRQLLTVPNALLLVFGLLVLAGKGRRSAGLWLQTTPQGPAARLFRMLYMIAALFIASVIVLGNEYSPFLYFRF